MYLSTKPQRLATAKAPARLGTRLDNIEPKKKSMDQGSGSGPTSPSEVIVFNNTHQGSSKGNQSRAAIPEVPQCEELKQYLKDSWDRTLREAQERNATILWLKSDNETRVNVNTKKEGGHRNSSASPQPPRPKNNVHHNMRRQHQ